MEYSRLLLRASTASLGFATPRIPALGLREMFIETVVTCTAPNLICDFTLGTTIDPTQVALVQPIGYGVEICAPQPGYTFSLGFYLQINNPPVGTTRHLIRLSNPARFVGTYHSYSSGGGTVSLVVNAWGWGKGTTP